MANLTFTLTGFSELNAALTDLGPKLASNIAGRGMKAGGEVIAAAARARCPVSTIDEPHLRDSIVAVLKKSDGSGTRTLLIGFLKPASRHAGFVEFGTSHMAAEPFMRPALDSTGQTAIDVMGDIIGEDIEAAAAGYPLGKL